MKQSTLVPALLFSTPVWKRYLHQAKVSVTQEREGLPSTVNQWDTVWFWPESEQNSNGIFKARFPFFYYYSCLESTGEIFICIKTYIRRREKKRQTRECPTKGFFEPSAVPLSSSLLCSPQRWNLGSRLNGSRLLMERVSPEHTSRRLARH